MDKKLAKLRQEQQGTRKMVEELQAKYDNVFKSAVTLTTNVYRLKMGKIKSSRTDAQELRKVISFTKIN